jgi:hypothetical protein
MKAFAIAVVMISVVSFMTGAAAEPVTIQGDELKSLVVTQKGTTWTLSNGSRISFFPDGKLLHCTAKAGYETCDDGTYFVTDNSIERKYQHYYKKTGGFINIEVKRDGDKLIFDGFEVKYSTIPTLLPATEVQIHSLAGKDFKQNYKDEGLQVFNISRGMLLFACSSKYGCATTLPMKVTAPRIEWSFRDSYEGNSGKTLLVSEDGFILWGGRKLIPQ